MSDNSTHQTWEALAILTLIIMAIATALPSWPAALGVFICGVLVLFAAVWMAR